MPSIDHFNLRSFDLNLVLAFDALMQELSVTNAAARLHIRQPAMSHALSTLRLLLQDQLFVRAGPRMEPTSRARELAPVLRKLLEDAQTALMSRVAFEPGHATGIFRIGVNVQLEVLVMPPLLEVLRAQSPGMSVVTSSMTRQSVFGLLDEGDIDLAIGYLPGGHARHKRATLYEESHVCCFRRGTVGHAGNVTADEYVRLPHGFISGKSSSLGYLEDTYSKAGIRPQVVLSTPNVMTLAATAATSPILITVTSRVAQRYASLFDLDISPVPFKLQPLPVDMVWHSREDKEPSNEWLREHVRQLNTTIGRSKLRTASRKKLVGN